MTRFNKKNKSFDGYNNVCRKCINNWDEFKEEKITQDGFKICNTCNEEKELADENFSKLKSQSDGYNVTCKKCKNKQYLKTKKAFMLSCRKRAQSNLLLWGSDRSKFRTGLKICSKCGVEYPQNEEYFTINKYSKDGLYPSCKKCEKKIRRENREKNIEYNKIYRDKNKDKSALYYNSNAKYNKKQFETLSLYYNVRIDKNNNDIIEVECAFCKKWHNVTTRNVINNIYIINSRNHLPYFYCSDECKSRCPLFNNKTGKIKKDEKEERDVSLWIKKKCLERDQYTCKKCGDTDIKLNVHHILPYSEYPQLGSDIDNLITLCVDCHKKIHKNEGCKIHQLGCK